MAYKMRYFNSLLQKRVLNPKFALGRGILANNAGLFLPQKIRAVSHHYALTFFVEKVSALFVSVLAPNAKFGLNQGGSSRRIFFPGSFIEGKMLSITYLSNLNAKRVESGNS